MWKKIDKVGDCWVWNGTVGNHGYGKINDFGDMVLTHRVSYEATYGKIPEGMQVLHKCDVKLCVNPDHLFIGTQKDNVQDMLRKGRNRNQWSG